MNRSQKKSLVAQDRRCFVNDFQKGCVNTDQEEAMHRGVQCILYIPVYNMYPSAQNAVLMPSDHCLIPPPEHIVWCSRYIYSEIL